MKLLGWMHRKLLQNSGDVFKDFAGGGTCNCLSGRPSLEEEDERRLRRRAFQLDGSFLPQPVGHFPGGGGDAAIEELLGGLLTIGTLGIAPDPVEEEAEEFSTVAEEEALDEAEAQKLLEPEALAAEAVAIPATMDAIAEKEAEATTETDLLVLSVGLEKALAAEAEKCRPSSGERISSARQSHGGSTACPLQGFLFGLPVELAETMPAASARSQRRASLGELFMNNRIAEEEIGDGGERSIGCERTEKAAGGGGAEGKPAVNGVHGMMKKMLKRGKSKGSDGTPAEESTVENKFQKIFQMFHRKVYPETSNMSKKRPKQCKNEIKDHEALTEADDGTGSGSRRLITFKGACGKESIPSLICCLNSPSFTLSGSDSNGSREHWIKTDADYLVLEL